MLKRAYKNGACPEWITADSVYGDNGKFRLWLEKKNNNSYYLKFIVLISSMLFKVYTDFHLFTKSKSFNIF